MALSQKDCLIRAGLIPWICFALLELWIIFTTPATVRKPYEVGDHIWTGPGGISNMHRYEIKSIEGVIFTLEDTKTKEIIIKEIGHE